MFFEALLLRVDTKEPLLHDMRHIDIPSGASDDSIGDRSIFHSVSGAKFQPSADLVH